MITKAQLAKALDYWDAVDILVQGPSDSREKTRCRFLLIQRKKDQQYAIVYGHEESMNFLTYHDTEGETKLYVQPKAETQWYKGSGLVMDLLGRDPGGRKIFVAFRDKVRNYFK
jgi:hypothetical protein